MSIRLNIIRLAAAAATVPLLGGALPSPAQAQQVWDNQDTYGCSATIAPYGIRPGDIIRHFGRTGACQDLGQPVYRERRNEWRDREDWREREYRHREREREREWREPPRGYGPPPGYYNPQYRY